MPGAHADVRQVACRGSTPRLRRLPRYAAELLLLSRWGAARADHMAATAHLRVVFQATRKMRLSETYRSISRFESCMSCMYLGGRAFVRLPCCDELWADSAAVISYECRKRPIIDASHEVAVWMRRSGTVPILGVLEDWGRVRINEYEVRGRG